MGPNDYTQMGPNDLELPQGPLQNTVLQAGRTICVQSSIGGEAKVFSSFPHNCYSESGL